MRYEASSPQFQPRRGAIRPQGLRDIWPTNEEVAATVRAAINRGMFEHEYAHAFDGDKNWRSLSIPEGGIYVLRQLAV